MNSQYKQSRQEGEIKKIFHSEMMISQSQCPICLQEYDLLRIVPMMICYNQHSVCAKCLSNVYQKRTCPTCCEKLISRNDVKKNRLLCFMLEEMYRGNGEVLLQTKNFTYKGEVKNGKRHGIGEQITKQGDFLKGRFIQGQLAGPCEYVTKNGAKFSGSGKGGQLDGTFTTKYGSIVEGIFDMETLSGPNCVKKYTNGDEFTGMIHRLKANGFGKLRFRSGGTFEGNFINDYIEKEGTGTISGTFQVDIQNSYPHIRQLQQQIKSNYSESEFESESSDSESSNLDDQSRNDER